MLLSVNDQPLSGSLAYEVSTDENEELEKYLAYIHTVYPVFGIGLCSVVLNEQSSSDGAVFSRSVMKIPRWAELSWAI